MEAFARHFAAYGREKLFGCLNNFHVLAWISGQVDSLPLDKTSFDSLLATLRNRESVSEWADNCPAWSSLELILLTLESGNSPLTFHWIWITLRIAPVFCYFLGGRNAASPMDISSGAAVSSGAHQGGKSSTSVATTTSSFRDVLVGLSSSGSGSRNDLVGTEEGENFWACQHCTLHNSLDKTECEMCCLPRHGS